MTFDDVMIYYWEEGFIYHSTTDHGLRVTGQTLPWLLQQSTVIVPRLPTEASCGPALRPTPRADCPDDLNRGSKTNLLS